MSKKLLGGVEAGGTKMVCAVAYEPGSILEEVRFPTTDPEETLSRVGEFFSAAETKYGSLFSLGYGTFGPACVSAESNAYGKILNTPKPGWQGIDVLKFLTKKFPSVSLTFDTDVNAAAIGEGYYGAARGLKNYIYVTVGTGIGGGVVMEGKPLHARPHAEIGHMLIPLLDEKEGFQGSCKFHGKCLEGLASGSAMEQCWGVPARDLAPDHEAWDLEAGYLAAMVQNLVACYAPEKIILGGGVMEQEFLLEKIRACCLSGMAGYWSVDDDLLVLPELGNQAGITGALMMASSA